MNHFFNKVEQTLIVIVVSCVLLCNSLTAQSKLTKEIKLNQVGYLTSCTKLAIVNVGKAHLTKFYVKSTDRVILYYEGFLSDSSYWSASSESVKRADFTNFNLQGKYVLEVPGLGYSYPFEVKGMLYSGLSIDAIRYYYLNRASTDIPKQYGGIYARAGGHPDTALYIHATAASTQRPEGTKVKAAKGWYDAGDYGCYTTNAGISTYTLMLSYDIFKDYYDTLKLNIPEGGNQTPDILDEIRWNLDWLLSMQDPDDGGVYFKKVSLEFPPFIMPKDDYADRYLVNKSTQSALDFTAVMSYASRLYRKYDVAYADRCLDAAKYAYQWALTNPNKLIRKNTDDDKSGSYADGSAPNDELFWAKSELYITTKDDSYFPTFLSFYPLAGWPNVGILGCYSLVQNMDSLTQFGKDNLSKMQDPIVKLGSSRQATYLSSAYQSMIQSGDFYWGSNSVLLNAMLNHYFAFKINNDPNYLKAIAQSFDYILGKNGVSMSFITKYGTNVPKYPHHRISSATGKILPGMLVGGPNPNNTYDCGGPSDYTYTSTLPALCYYDDVCSYSTNETAINWNAPLVFVITALLKEYKCDELPVRQSYKSFSVNKNGCSIDLAFETSNEADVARYFVEKSVDGKSFERLMEVPNNNSGKYGLHDSLIGFNRVYYRVVSETRLSDALIYQTTASQGIDFAQLFLNTFPNPVKDFITIEIPCYVKGTYEVHNQLGLLVATGNLESSSSQLNCTSLGAGTYIFTFMVNGTRYKRRIVVS